MSDATRRTIRTVVQVVVGLAAALPLVVATSGLGDVEALAPYVGAALVVAGAITRVMALPVVESFLARYVPWLSAGGAGEGEQA